MSVKQLVEELKYIVNHPKKLLLFEYVRYLFFNYLLIYLFLHDNLLS